MSRELILYCDESDQDGKYCSNFYGGVLVDAKDLKECVETLENKKASLNIHGEVKWTKVSEAYFEKYRDLVDEYFNLVEANKAKTRIMFKQTYHKATNLTKEQDDNRYFLLYYQFIKHSFGLQYSNPDKVPTHLRIYLDRLPDKAEKCQAFKSYVQNLENSIQFRAGRVRIRKEHIGEVISHDHILLQCMDVVLGAMCFRLNLKHKEIPEGKRRRGKKTVIKEKLYKHIHSRIIKIYPRFNIGTSTGTHEGQHVHWTHPYRHWRFIPSEFEIDETRVKPK